MTGSTCARPVLAYAPGRVNLIGEHTDYNRGFALPIAPQVGTVVEYVPDDGAEIVATTDAAVGAARIPVGTERGAVSGWAGYVAGCVWALRTSGVPVRGGRLRIRSEVPVGAGLSSSAALECAVLLVLTSGSNPDRHHLARLAQRAENEYVGAPTGLLDQLASLYGAPDTALLIDFDSLAVQQVPVRMGDAVSLLVIDSRAPHRHAAGEYAARRASCAAAAAELGVPSLRDADVGAWRRLGDGIAARRARHVLTEDARVLAAAEGLRERNFEGVGRLMNASHASMRDDFEITTELIDLIAQTARDLGAYGARMTGGGFGGSVIALAPAGAADRIAAELPGVVEAAGHRAPEVRSVRPGAGAQLM